MRWLFEVGAKDAEFRDPRPIVAAPLGGSHFVPPDAAESETREEARGAILPGASEHIAEAALERLRHHLPHQLRGHALPLKAGKSVEPRDLAGPLAPIRFGQQRAYPGQMLVADPVAEARRQDLSDLLAAAMEQEPFALAAQDQRLDLPEVVD